MNIIIHNKRKKKLVHTRHLALAKFFSNCAHTPSFKFFSDAPFPAILGRGVRAEE